MFSGDLNSHSGEKKQRKTKKKIKLTNKKQQRFGDQKLPGWNENESCGQETLPGKPWKRLASLKAYNLDSEYGLCDIQQEVMYVTSNEGSVYWKLFILGDSKD